MKTVANINYAARLLILSDRNNDAAVNLGAVIDFVLKIIITGVITELFPF